MAGANIIPVDFGPGTSSDAGESDAGYDYDHQCELMRERNKRYLDLFEADMRAAGLSESTIGRHLDNVDFYLNEYLLYYDVNDMEYGCHDVYGFLGDWFIRKCAWSTPGTIKTNAASIKKFYKCMRDNGLIGADAYNELARTIKENMADWQADCAEFNDPANFDNPFLDSVDGGGLPFGAGAELGALFGGDSKLEGYFRESLREVLRERLVEEFGPELDKVAARVRRAFADAAGVAAEAEPPTRDEVIDVFTLALFYLTSWEERVGGKGGFKLRKAWKSADWGALDRLREDGLVDCSNKAKSVTVTDAGVEEARAFLQALGLEHLAE